MKNQRHLAITIALLCLVTLSAPAQTAVDITPETLVPDAVGVKDVEISPFGTFIVIYDQTEGNSIRLFDASLTQRWRVRLPYYWAGSLDPGSVIQVAPDESYVPLPGGRTDTDICMCDPVTGETLAVLQAHKNDPDELALSPDGRWLVSASYNELILWERDGETFTARQITGEFAPATHSIEFLADSERFAISNSEQTLRSITVYRVSSGQMVEEFRHEFSDNNISFEVEHLAVSPDGKLLAAGYRDTVLLFTVDDAAIEKNGEITDIDVGAVSTIAFSPDSRHLVTGHYRFVKWWTQAGSRWTEVATHPTQQSVVHDLEISQDGRYLYSASREDENALIRFDLAGIGPSPVGTVTSVLDGALSVAQRRVLTPALAARIVGNLGENALAPRDMFETADEYAARRSSTRGAVLEQLLDAVEDRYDAQQVPNTAAVYDVRVPLQAQGSYDIDRQRYSLETMDTEAWLHIDRTAARSLYQLWENARLRATRYSRDDTPAYADFRLDHPDGSSEYPLVIEQNPFTGERMNTARNLVPAISVGPDLLVRDLELDGIFPALHANYASEPFGRFTVENRGTGIVSAISISFSLGSLSEGSYTVELPDSLAAGRSTGASLLAPVSPDVLATSEGGTATLTITASYRRSGQTHVEEFSRQIRVLNRNAIQWSDDLRIGSFLTVSHPVVLGWSGRVVGSAQMTPTPVLTRNLLYATHLYQSLATADIDYVIDPNSAYASLSADNQAVDYLRFPAETLSQGAGDCDDLSALLAALLESVGVATAFVTTPGHVFIAFDTGLAERDARARFSASDDLIYQSGKVWMPVETTVLSQGFTRAWQVGALQWRQASEAGTVGFFTAQEAWSNYSPVAPPLTVTVSPPDEADIKASVQDELAAYREVELNPKLARLDRESDGAQTPATQNQRGVLYATYGMLDQAAAEFAKALDTTDYVPALINQANLMSLWERPDEARQYLERAREVDPDNPRVLIGLAFSYWESGDQVAARDTFEIASRASPSLARRFPLFAGESDSDGSRAGAADSIFSLDWVGTE